MAPPRVPDPHPKKMSASSTYTFQNLPSLPPFDVRGRANMADNSAHESNTTLQETQFAPSALIDVVVNDEENVQQQQQQVIIEPTVENVRHDAANHLVNNYGTVAVSRPKNGESRSPSISTRAIGPDLLRGLVMVLEAIDHSAMACTAWMHGQALVGEASSTRMTQWNVPIAYTARLFTHLCAPAFMFLLGMGVVYFGRSRSKLGWTTSQMVRHFFVRAAVLAIVNQVLSIVLTRKLKPSLNICLLALAFNYFAAGMIWLLVSWTERRLSKVVVKVIPDPSKDPETNPLLHTNPDASSAHSAVQDVAAQASFHLHNVLLLVLAGVTVWWNIWLDPKHGHCNSGPSQPPSPKRNIVFEFFFHMLQNEYMFSGFPPLAWVSPAILGLLYGRIVTSRQWRPMVINSANLVVGLTLFTLFVLTRVVHFGNLDEGCLAMPEHIAHPNRNQYLASVQSFFYLDKYPPSPSYLFFTMGVNFILLALFGTIPTKAVKRIPLSVLLIFGTSALFFYTVHLPLYFALGSVAKGLFGHQMDFDDFMNPGHKAWGVGPGIFFWVTWLIGLLILWPTCRWYGQFKASKGPDSIWRFF